MRYALGFVLCLLAAAAAAQSPPGRAVLGVATVDVPPNPRVHGAWVRQVMPGSAAGEAGVQPNDVIVAIDGHPIPAAAALVAYVRGLQPGQTVTLEILRPNGNDADELTLNAELGGAAPAEQQPAPAAPPPAPSGPLAAAGPAAPPDVARDAPAWVAFTDPQEQAFSTEVPQGWRVVGGLFHRGPIAASPWVRMLAPDRRTYIVVGDPDITYFTTPLPYGGNPPPRPFQVVRPYRTGVEFSRDYATRILPAVCSDVAINGEKDRPDLTRGPWAQANPQARHSGGEVTFTCRLNGVAAGGMVVADTYIYPVRGNFSSFWTVDLHAGFVAALDRIPAATQETIHVLTAWRMNPDWVRRQQATIDAATRAINANTAAMMQWGQQQIIHQQNQMHAMTQQSEAFDRILTGNSPYADGAGNTYQLDNTKTQWIGPGGRTLGTSGASPGPAWQRLQEVPPQ